MSRDVFILSGARTPIGSFGGSLKDHSPTMLGSIAAQAAIARAGIDAEAVDNSVFGTVIPTETADLFLGRTVGIGAGLRDTSQGFTVNRLCGSGVQAIVSAAQMIQLGESKVAVAGGAEAMSRSPFSINGMRFGHRMGDGVIYDWLTNTLADPFGHGAMGCTGENVAEKYQITRERQDAFALTSQKRAGDAVKDGRFAEQVAPVLVRDRKSERVFDTDEYPKPHTSMDDLAKLKAVFRKGGTVTAGNASGINDGGAAIVLAGEIEVSRRNLKPMARIVSWGIAGVPPEIMGIGPVTAVPVALERAKLSMADIDVIECNEAFAAQALAVCDGLALASDKVNPNGGAIALGHPLGATGAILTVKAMYELRRTKGRFGLITMCIGGGQGIAMIIENVA